MKIAVIGAGPGGLSAGMLLQKRGFDVTIYEKMDRVGGRNSCFKENGYTFDIGPTFFMMPFILEEIFAETGRDINDYVELKLLDPYYQLVFADGNKIYPSYDPEKIKSSIKKISPEDVAGYDRYMKDNEKKMQRTLPVLQKGYSSFKDILKPEILKLLPVLKPGQSLWENLGEYFEDDRVKVGFTFQSKYLGMSPYNCPSMFSILPYTEYKWGVYHVMGGLHQLSQVMAEVFEEMGGTIKLNKTIQEIEIEKKKSTGLFFQDGSYQQYNEIIMNADFAWGMKNLIPDKKRKKYTDVLLENKKYSCSTFMLYLGLDKIYDNLMHHNVFIAEDYNKNFMEIESTKTLSQDPSFYIQNPSVTDKTLAPEGHSALYVLVPVANLKSSIDWKEEKDNYRNLIIKKLKTRVGLEDLEEHITYEKILTPLDWREDINVGFGATFNLAHSLDQMLIFRPHNKFEEFKNMWIVGGGTSPGSGLPTIYESGRITANILSKKYSMNYNIPGLDYDKYANSSLEI
ncbi:MAG: phytoene desaturase family protein [Bacillota bacterium]